MRHPRRNEVFRDVGSEEHAPDDADFIEVQRIPFDADSGLLLCSDGLSDLVPSAEIQAHRGAPCRRPRSRRPRSDRTPPTARAARITSPWCWWKASSSPRRRRLRRGPARAATAGAAAAGRSSARVPRGLCTGCCWRRARRGFRAACGFLQPVVIQPRVLTVGPGAPYPTIAAAMADARAGDTVDVPVGEYHEQVPLETGRHRAQPRAARGRAARIAGFGRPGGGAPKDVKDARITGFQIVGDHAPAALHRRPAGKRRGGSGRPGYCRRRRGHRNSRRRPRLVVGNSVRDCTAQGILITGNAAPWVSHNSVQRCKVAGLVARRRVKTNPGG